MEQALQRAWLRRGALARLLWAFALVFGALAALRRLAYRLAIFKSERLPVPVVVVGNVVVGGAGKTPIVIAIVQHLRARGIAAGVVSRGHGRVAADCREVGPASDPGQVGDEPLLIARACGVPVFVAPRRADAARALLKAHPGTRVIVCDDGLQHYGLQRDIEICVFDERGTGNGWLLPAGPLREAWPRRVDLVVRPAHARGIDGFEVTRRLAAHARRADGTQLELSALKGRELTAVAGIARPQAFFAMLREAGLQLRHALALPDHHDFARPSPLLEAGELICTEKDAVKLWARYPRAWAVPLAVTLDPGFWPALDRLLDAKLSSPHGPQTS
jgi:tetraacyldisaccharide 4'-kinase